MPSVERRRGVLDLEDAAALEHDVDLVLVVRLLPVGLGSDEHVDADLEPGRGVDDLVAASALDERAPRLRRRRTGARGADTASQCTVYARCDAPPVEIDLDALFQPGRASTSGWRRMPAVAGRDGRDEPSSRDPRGP